MFSWLKNLTGQTRILAISVMAAGGLAVLLVVGATVYNIFMPTNGAFAGLFVTDLRSSSTTTQSETPSETFSDSATPPTRGTAAPRVISPFVDYYPSPTRTTSSTSPRPTTTSPSPSPTTTSPTPTPTPTPVPLAPAITAATWLDGTSFSVDWAAPSNSIESGVASYTVSWTSDLGSGSCSVSGTTATCSGVSGTGVTATVVAIGTTGSSSDTVTLP
ncbi:MAG: hypothetical protein ACKOXM_00610 [Agromyces sp.]